MGVPLVRGRAHHRTGCRRLASRCGRERDVCETRLRGSRSNRQGARDPPDNPAIPRRRSIIVGVVRDVANQTLLGATEPEAYYSYRQEGIYADSLVLRIGSDPWPMVIPVRDTNPGDDREGPPIAIETCGSGSPARSFPSDSRPSSLYCSPLSVGLGRRGDLRRDQLFGRALHA